ncbi:Gfo/Idh/MocA family oxidoreductase [Bosea sp. 2KB_26]|uniref:Gfo/Idh/MocA family protein n=1 Tax=Bosea sp. 2KB_26 TaxID=3237475 RepID=UPI000DE4662C
MRALGVGLIGTGYMGKCHALAWNAVAPVFGDVARPRLAMLCELDDALAARRAREFGFAQSTADWRALVAHPDVDIVSITTPNAFHAEMAIAALEAGKHVWCEKPMATSLADAQAMLASARAAGTVAVLGYNYIQNPAIRLAARLIGEGAIGPVNHVRVEMDEDFMADAEAHFSWKSAAQSGHGALDDFGVHAFSLLKVLVGEVAQVMADMARPYPTRPRPEGGARPVETHDIATLLLRLASGASGLVALNRCAWGRKGRIFVQVFGAKGTISFDQERMNEIELYTADGRSDLQGFRRILTAPAHEPYDHFVPAPGHGLGFNELKIIECRELMRSIAGEPAHLIDFETGLRIERTVEAAARSFREGRWAAV